MLLAVYTLSFVDRVIMGILAPPIKAELQLTDTQLGFIGGTAFALFYTALGIPMGRLADRWHRVRIIAVSLAVWSAFTAAGGLVHNFLQLFLARLGVGIGEAGGVAPAYSLISDYFPRGKRARALAVYSFGIPIGSGAGLLFGGLFAARVNWRSTFLVAGALGVALAPLFARLVREPVRGGMDILRDCTASMPTPQGSPTNPFGKLSFWCLSLGGAASSIMGYGMLFWLPSFFVRSYHFTLPQTSLYLSLLTLTGGVIGIWLSGWLTDRLGTLRRSAYALVPAAACLLCLPCYALSVMAQPGPWTLAAFLVPTALALVWLSPTVCAIQHLVRADGRAFASASFLFIVNLIGLGLER